MSADNFLGIYKINSRKYIGRGCWFECERVNCKNCEIRAVFVARSLLEAIKLAQEACGNYEYGYKFLNMDISF